ncbi:hypothetical protein DOTSEDRAFT_69745 [Dothistroma septosporum NZE10]|uniref:AA1-like domain-containing protein n=1 Tax=Dothistroma septosporum (strain NZE10 / CBS 128990) TaxID=675120 RepID=N1PWK5_DOTSN|nr:hypothetical protein DOTSEDRAFT_69745 [Dothistroma septosporum NZE10]
MRVTSLVSSLALLGVTSCAHPHHRARAAQSGNPDLEITKLIIDRVRNGNTTISFRLYNPDPLSGANATCTSTWVSTTKGNPQGDYELCGESKFAWAFDTYNDINNFTLNVEDRFTDPAVGDPPYDQVTVFGIAIFNKTNLVCEAMGDASCGIPNDTIVEAPIYATTA